MSVATVVLRFGVEGRCRLPEILAQRPCKGLFCAGRPQSGLQMFGVGGANDSRRRMSRRPTTQGAAHAGEIAPPVLLSVGGSGEPSSDLWGLVGGPGPPSPEGGPPEVGSHLTRRDAAVICYRPEASWDFASSSQGGSYRPISTVSLPHLQGLC